MQPLSTRLLSRTVLTTSNASCRALLQGDSAILNCNSSGIIDLDQLIGLCELDYESDPVNIKCVPF